MSKHLPEIDGTITSTAVKKQETSYGNFGIRRKLVAIQ